MSRPNIILSQLPAARPGAYVACASLFFCALSCSQASSNQRPGGGDQAALSRQQAAAAGAVHALQEGRFEDASREATQVLGHDATNPQARLVRALTRYKAASHQFGKDIRTVLFSGGRGGGLNQQYLRFTATQTEAAFGQVEADLDVASRQHGVSMDLCLACWKVDWNQNGRIDSADERLFQIELDAQGQELPSDDPRRVPTFRFDVGDVYWARAMVAFQRAVLDLILAYRFDELYRAIETNKDPVTLTFALADRERVVQARKQVLIGLAHAEQTRREYLAETDDEREWVPNPRQKSHPMPLPVDDRLYETWEGVVGDLQRLALGKEGLSVAEVAQLGKRQWENPPSGFLNLGLLLSEPKDIVISLKQLDSLANGREATAHFLSDVFGAAYVEKMRPSMLISRLLRMSKEVEHGEESHERKLRYLLWLN